MRPPCPPASTASVTVERSVDGCAGHAEFSPPTRRLGIRCRLIAPCRSRTCNLRFRRPTLYPIELKVLIPANGESFHHPQRHVKVAFARASLTHSIALWLYIPSKPTASCIPHLEEEWLITNGSGGFASGTLVGCNTRRYHGLLCAATNPPVGRRHAAQPPGRNHSRRGPADRCAGIFRQSVWRHAFILAGTGISAGLIWKCLARWEYEVEGIRVIKEVQMPWQKQRGWHPLYRSIPAEKDVEISLLAVRPT